MYYDELIFSDIVKDYHEKFLNVKHTITDIDEIIKVGVIFIIIGRNILMQWTL